MLHKNQRSALVAACLTIVISSVCAQTQTPGAISPIGGAAAQAPSTPVVPPLPAAIVNASNKPGAGMSSEDFSSLLKQKLPLSPEQVREVNRQSTEIRKAKVAPVGPAPRPVSVTARVTLDAGANPHVLRLNVDTVTSLVFTDITGAPWNVQRVVAGARDVLDISEKSADTKSHMFTIAPKEDFVNTNLAIFLEGAPAPVVMAVVTNQANVDFRVDVSVQARGPSAVMPAISRGLADSVPAELISMVAGVSPAGSRPLKVVMSDISDVQAWVLGNRMYVRTKANILTPAVPKDGKVATGSDGTKVYELPLSPEVRLMSNGVVGRLQLSGFLTPGFNPLNAQTSTR
jgi:intracellular multiplication protein IcmK